MKLRIDLGVFVAVIALLGLVFVALFGERVAPHESVYFVVEHGTDPRPYDPGLVFPFGSDVLGRDLITLVLAGARTTLTIVLLGGLARVSAGVLVAATSRWWRPAGLVTESIAELLSAVPATLVALVLVKILVKTDANVLTIVSALLVTGWAGPYRVIRAELDRLAQMSFTEGALALGLGRWRVLWRHHVPHLVPVIAINLSQQVIASLVLVAELGVLGVFVGATRVINIEESLSRVVTGQTNIAQIADPPEWGGLLANARTIESLWLTRWLVLVPGVAFALTAIAVATIGFVVGRRYARRDLIDDLRKPVALALGGAIFGLFMLSLFVPARYPAAQDFAAAARTQLRPNADLQRVFSESGLAPLADSYTLTREMSNVVQTGPATVKVGTAVATQPWGRAATPTDPFRVQTLVSADTGGGVVDAPLVFAGRGIVPSDYPSLPACPRVLCGRPDIGRFLQTYGDDYASVDVRGKVVLLVRFLGVATKGINAMQNDYAFGPSVDESIAGAIQRGAAAVIFVDPALTYYTDTVESYTIALGGIVGGVNPYLRLEHDSPATKTGGVPVVVVDGPTAQGLVAPLGLNILQYLNYDEVRTDKYNVSPARALGITARVEVPLQQQRASVASLAAEVRDVPRGAGRIVVWAVRASGSANPAADVVAALARALGPRPVPFVFVDFDPSIDPRLNAQAVGEALKDRRIALVIVLGKLDGKALRFTTPYGDLIPTMDLYAESAGARHELTRTTPTIGSFAGVAPFIKLKTVLVSGDGGDGDLRPDAAALIGYLAGRIALGAEELPR